MLQLYLMFDFPRKGSETSKSSATRVASRVTPPARSVLGIAPLLLSCLCSVSVLPSRCPASWTCRPCFRPKSFPSTRTFTRACTRSVVRSVDDFHESDPDGVIAIMINRRRGSRRRRMRSTGQYLFPNDFFATFIYEPFCVTYVKNRKGS